MKKLKNQKTVDKYLFIMKRNGHFLIHLFHWALSILPKNIQKLEIFRCLQGAWKNTSSTKWVTGKSKLKYDYNGIRTHNHLVCKRTLNHLAKWSSVRLQTKWLWFRVPLQSLKLQISRVFQARSSLTFRQLQSVDSLWNAYVTWWKHTVLNIILSEAVLQRCS